MRGFQRAHRLSLGLASSLGLVVVLLTSACARVGPLSVPVEIRPPGPAAPSAAPAAPSPPARVSEPVITPPPIERPALPQSDVSPPDGAPAGLRGPSASLPADTRALWVVRTALVHPDSVRAAVRRADAAGFNTLLVQVRGRGDAWYASGLEPRAIQLERLPAAFDPLALLIDEARGRGLRVHAWVNLQLVASALLPPTDPRHVIHAHPEWLAYPRALAADALRRDPRDPRLLEALMAWTRENPEQVEGIYASPVHPEARRHTIRVLEDLVTRYPLDGVHLDYVRLPSPAFDYSAPTLRAFALEVGGGWARTPDALLELPNRHPEAWRDFRVAALDALVSEVAAAVRARRSDLLLSAAVFSDPVDARNGRFQGWPDWLARGLLDVAVPMVYVTDPGMFEQRLSAAVQIVGPERIWVGLGIYRTSFVDAVHQARISRDRGVGGVVLFSYDWAVGPDGERTAGWGSEGYLRRWALEGWGR
jgi:uncharacterized lipoprotein YddW (UPF0748 family)